MQAKTFTWQTSNGKNLYGKDWQVRQPKAVVCLVHGFGEHCNRYEHWATYFNQQNIAVIAIDLPGHGQSEGKTGYVPSLNAFLDAISGLVVEATERYSKIPMFLYGHSMGGNLVLNYTLQRHPNLKGVIASAPWIQLPPDKEPSALLKIFIKIINKLFPKMTQASGLDASLISKDPKEVAAYENDPLVHDQLSIALAASMLTATNWLKQFSGKTKVPMLIMHGDADNLTLPQASEDFAKKLKGNVTYKKWANLYHEIHNEPEKRKVFDYTLKWMDSILNA